MSSKMTYMQLNCLHLLAPWHALITIVLFFIGCYLRKAKCLTWGHRYSYVVSEDRCCCQIFSVSRCVTATASATSTTTIATNVEQYISLQCAASARCTSHAWHSTEEYNYYTTVTAYFNPKQPLHYCSNLFGHSTYTYVSLTFLDNQPLNQSNKTNTVAWVRERTIPTDRPPLAGEFSANFCG
jgi:hypothetical protein